MVRQVCYRRFRRRSGHPRYRLGVVGIGTVRHAAGADRAAVAAACAAVGALPAGAALASIAIVDHRARQLDLWKLRRELARRPPRRWQPQPCDAGDWAHG